MAQTVSVVIPTYERPEFLPGSIKTAVEQTYDDIEVIVIDDGSKELYADKMVSEFSESVSCVRHEDNKGLSAARNTGIRNANGEYIAFLDDDDRWHKTKIARQVEAIKKDKQVGLVTCLVASISPDNEIIYCETSAPDGDCSEELLIGNSIGTPSRVLVRRKAINDVGAFDESLPTKQDWDFYMRLCQNWRVGAVEDYLCFRTIHESMSSSPESSKNDNETILDKHKARIRERGLWDLARAEVAERVGRAYLKGGDLKTARQHLRDSVSLDPTVRRRILLGLSYTHPNIVNRVTALKRAVQLRQSDCSELDLNSAEVPGLEL
ncbi:glycosyltransferase family A protein [Halorubrum sp. Hd13]|uniref:glycosyltransferase family 2 protein n=1 Tax=Halorubrum sp. Hd13 TaxID=1480728 RepID=UPI000B98EE1E|nr:glycosyltransferase family A protein [Halorubrum sp. Hd13]OYR42852.1 family 2 glycosyl transferase [Halorubrum sp. Hd13]